MWTAILPLCMFVHHIHAWCPWKLEESVRSPGTNLTDSCGCPCGCRAWDQGPREEQLALLSMCLSLQPQFHTLIQWNPFHPHFPSLIPLPLPSYLLHTFPSLFCVCPTEFNYNFLPENGQKVISMSQGDLSVLIRLKKMILPSPTSNNPLVDY